MKKILSVLAFLGYCLIFQAQGDDPTVATPLTTSFWSTGTFSAGTITGATGSGLTGYCSGVPTNDVFYSFTAVSQGVKIACTTADFDLVIELRDASSNLIDCTDVVVGVGGETHWSTNLTVGNTYYIAIYSVGAAGGGNFQINAEWLPAAEVRSTYVQFPATDSGLPGYKITESTRRVTNNSFPINMSGLIQATRWKLVDQVTGTIYLSDVSGDNQLLNLNTVIGPLCFNKIYDVQCQVMVDGQWCGYSTIQEIWTEIEPNTTLSASYIGASYDLSANIKAVFTGSSQYLYWKLITDNGTTQIDFNYPNNTTSWLNFPDVPCMRFNKIYQLQIAVEYCGAIGPYSAPVNIFTVNVPYTKVRTEYCNTQQFTGGTILCDFIASIDTYAWQFAPIVENDPNMVPIGPAIVSYSYNTATMALSTLVPLGLEQGQAYKVGVKPILGNFDSCNEPQQGDYGDFCQIVTISTGPTPPQSPGMTGIESKVGNYTPTEKDFVLADQKGKLNLFESMGGDKIVQIVLKDSRLSGAGHFTVYDLNGRLVDETYFPAMEEAYDVKYALPGNLDSGIYIFSITTPEGIVSEKIYLH